MQTKSNISLLLLASLIAQPIGCTLEETTADIPQASGESGTDDGNDTDPTEDSEGDDDNDSAEGGGGSAGEDEADPCVQGARLPRTR